MKVKIGVLSDTHLQCVTGVFKRIYDQWLAEVDVILHAGDFVSEEIVTFLRKKPFHGVHGKSTERALKGTSRKGSWLNFRMWMLSFSDILTGRKIDKRVGSFFSTRVLQAVIHHPALIQSG